MGKISVWDWGIVNKNNCKNYNEIIGQCGLRFLANTIEFELVYAVVKAYRNQGIATEAAKASIKYGFEELNAERIVALAAPQNIASQKVMEKVGMKYEKKQFFYNTSVNLYSITK
ncbi:MAG: GNAT family N-acetyltransferase [Calothrix sp. SM1_7_51]|nr:GNAT family N-acetyltransferase [Calothrix sp. SM1_7_51]